MARTLRSRIAAVAVAAVGAGMLVATPASAAVPTRFIFSTAEAIGTDGDTAVQIAGASNFVQIKSKAAATAGSVVRLDVSGSGATFDSSVTTTGTFSGTAASWTANTAKTSLTSSSALIWESSSKYQSAKVYTPTAGTVTVKVYEITGPVSGVYTETLKDTLTVTVNSAATSGTLSVSKSSSVISEGDTYAPAVAGTDDEVVADGITIGQARATVKITLLDVNGAAMPDTTTVGATVSGPGSVDLNTDEEDAAYATSGRVRSATTLSGVLYAKIYSDGTAGVSKVTFTVGSTVVATETVTFYGKVASLTVTQGKYSIGDTSAPSSCVSHAIANLDNVVASITAKDANGVAVPLSYSDFSAISSTVKTAQNLTAVAFCNGNDTNLDASAVAVLVTPTAAKTGAKTFTVKHTDTEVTATVSFTVSAAKASSVTITTDKASYATGEAIKYTVSAKDKDGNIIADGPYTGAVASKTNVYQNASLPANLTFKNGVATFTLYAPSTAGDFTYTATLASPLVVAALVDTTVSASAKVVADTSAIDAVKAQVAALSTTVISIQTAVATLIASVSATLTVMQSQINKIIKKFKIK